MNKMVLSDNAYRYSLLVEWLAKTGRLAVLDVDYTLTSFLWDISGRIAVRRTSLPS